MKTVALISFAFSFLLGSAAHSAVDAKCQLSAEPAFNRLGKMGAKAEGKTQKGLKSYVAPCKQALKELRRSSDLEDAIGCKDELIEEPVAAPDSKNFLKTCFDKKGRKLEFKYTVKALPEGSELESSWQ